MSLQIRRCKLYYSLIGISIWESMVIQIVDESHRMQKNISCELWRKPAHFVSCEANSNYLTRDSFP